jgi:UDP-N-acetylmuramoyl-tripeptide--D-alanyl-D-alanine ligase
MRAALDVLAQIPGRRVFVMGDMGEIGENVGQMHDEIGGYAKSHGIDRLLALGDAAQAAVANFGQGGEHFGALPDLLAVLEKELGATTTVLVKGSRFMRMERVADAVADGASDGQAPAVLLRPADAGATPLAPAAGGSEVKNAT